MADEPMSAEEARRWLDWYMADPTWDDAPTTSAGAYAEWVASRPGPSSVGRAFAAIIHHAEEADRLRAEVASLRATLGEHTDAEPIGCPTPGSCSAMALQERVAALANRARPLLAATEGHTPGPWWDPATQLRSVHLDVLIDHWTQPNRACAEFAPDLRTLLADLVNAVDGGSDV